MKIQDGGQGVARGLSASSELLVKIICNITTGYLLGGGDDRYGPRLPENFSSEVLFSLNWTNLHI